MYFIENRRGAFKLVERSQEPSPFKEMKYTKGKIQTRASLEAVTTGNGSLILAGTLTLAPGSSAANRALILILTLTNSSNPPVFQVQINEGGVTPPLFLFSSGGNANNFIEYYIAMFFSHATTSVVLTYLAGSAGSSIATRGFYGGGELIRPQQFLEVP